MARKRGSCKAPTRSRCVFDHLARPTTWTEALVWSGRRKVCNKKWRTRRDLTKRGSVRPVAAIAVIIRDFESLILTALIAAISVQSASDQLLNKRLFRALDQRAQQCQWPAAAGSCQETCSTLQP